MLSGQREDMNLVLRTWFDDRRRVILLEITSL